MFIRIETTTGVPISRQIADQLRALCATGGLKCGDRVPSVRQLAKELAVNQNTIQHVYERLTLEGLLERRQGDGTFVAQSLPADRAQVPRDQLIADMDRLAHRAIELGIGADEASALLNVAFARIQKQRNAHIEGRSP